MQGLITLGNYISSSFNLHWLALFRIGIHLPCPFWPLTPPPLAISLYWSYTSGSSWRILTLRPPDSNGGWGDPAVPVDQAINRFDTMDWNKVYEEIQQLHGQRLFKLPYFESQKNSCFIDLRMDIRYFDGFIIGAFTLKIVASYTLTVIRCPYTTLAHVWYLG